MSDSSTDASLLAGQAALRAGRFVEALESYERVLDHHRPDAWPGCDDACEAALRGLVIVVGGVEVEPERMRRFLAAALPHATTGSQILLDAARIYLRLGEVDQVLAMLWKARAHNAHREVAAVLDEPAFTALVADDRFRDLVDDLPGARASGDGRYPRTGRWVSGLHRHTMARLVAGPAPQALEIREYVDALQRIESGSRGRWRGVGACLDAEVAEAAAFWARHCAGEDRPAESRDRSDLRVLEAGIRATVRLYDKELAPALYAEWRRRDSRRPSSKHSRLGSFMDGVVDDCPQCVRDMQTLAAGGFDDACAQLVRAGRPAEAYTDDEVALIAWVSAGRHPGKRLFAQRDRNLVWYTDLRYGYEPIVFDGTSIQPPTLPCATWPASDADFVAGATGCDERVVGWSGRHTYRVAQRYGRHVLLMNSQYFTSRDGAEMTGVVWLSPPSAREASALMSDIAASAPKGFKRLPVWSDARHGAVMRSYDDQTAVGIWGNRWVRGSVNPTLDEEFASEASAIAAFEAMELEKLKAGETITNFWLWHPDRPDR
ncbi:hypothetical protein Dvina_40995 [Dactylosporangium vinaceum]|uniref:Tetratricopeptide repeat protein n=1 Tax=Dactylosporangium vinaceum TaxID=53362 RepID=A0ABV5M3V0_9ACTN|nr:hypothetical protein [Dactylosporangium vinaceum]UAB94463.1 hypothetical protein Dvina_40995 [Dactylosporangium vinaceum]